MDSEMIKGVFLYTNDNDIFTSLYFVSIVSLLDSSLLKLSTYCINPEVMLASYAWSSHKPMIKFKFLLESNYRNC